MLACTAACGPSASVDRDGGPLRDRGSPEAPPAPTVDPHPSPVPWPVATLQGAAPQARRIIVDGAGNPLIKRVGTGGSFCIDVPMETVGVYDFSIQAQGEDGLLSSGEATLTVEFDPDAPAVEGQATCNGAPPGPCPSAVEDCDNNRDDNCNGLADLRDPDCMDCPDDAFEPNDDVTAPRVEPIRHEGLVLCEGDTDYYGVFVNEGETLDARLLFVHADGDLDMALLAPDWSSELRKSETTTDDEVITHVAEQTGEYKLRVYSPGSAGNTYALLLSVGAS